MSADCDADGIMLESEPAEPSPPPLSPTPLSVPPPRSPLPPPAVGGRDGGSELPRAAAISSSTDAPPRAATSDIARASRTSLAASAFTRLGIER